MTTDSPQASPGLYIHIPFCQSRCGYCDFAVYTDRDDHQADYVETLEREIRFWHVHCPRAFQTVYFGGGTPSRLQIRHWQHLLRCLKNDLDLSQVVEITAEANPESLSPELMDLWLAEGITRISLGVQSFHDHQLKILDRVHTGQKAFEAIDLIHQRPLKTWSLDLIYGLPQQGKDDWLENLEAVRRTGAPHLSFYNLIQHPNLPVTGLMAADDPEKRQEFDADIFLETVNFLTRNGYEVYELSNAAYPGHSCRHNLLYWRGGEWLGLGLSSWSYLEGRYFANPSSWQSYMETWKDLPDSIPVSVQQPAFESMLLDRIMLRLRLAEGLPDSELINWVGKDAFSKTRTFRDDLIRSGYLKPDPERIALTPKGWLLHSEIVTRLMRLSGL